MAGEMPGRKNSGGCCRQPADENEAGGAECQEDQEKQ